MDIGTCRPLSDELISETVWDLWVKRVWRYQRGNRNPYGRRTDNSRNGQKKKYKRTSKLCTMWVPTGLLFLQRYFEISQRTFATSFNNISVTGTGISQKSVLLVEKTTNLGQQVTGKLYKYKQFEDTTGVRPKKKICVFTVIRPTLFFSRRP